MMPDYRCAYACRYATQRRDHACCCEARRKSKIKSDNGAKRSPSAMPDRRSRVNRRAIFNRLLNLR